MDEQPIIIVKDLSVSFPAAGGKRLQAVDRSQMSIFPNQTLAVVGESGSGKSVTAMSILQLIPNPPGKYDSGHILWRRETGQPGGPSAASGPAYEDLLTFSERQMRKVRGNQIAMIFQEPMTSLNPVYTIGEQIIEAVLLHQRVPRREAIDIAEHALADVGIADPASRLGEFPHQLSGGMRQRVMIAMALACQPKLLLADEPTTALDVTIQAQILDLLRDLQRKRGMSVMLITHDLGVVAENADVVAVMYAGRVCEYGNVYDVFRRPLHPYTRGLLKSMPVLGHNVSRLPTVADGATPPDDFPRDYEVMPHEASPDQSAGGRGYGGHDVRLYEVEREHWVLCKPREGVKAEPTPPICAFRREGAAVAAGATSSNPGANGGPREGQPV